MFRVPRNGIRYLDVATTLPLASIAQEGCVSVAMKDDGAVRGCLQVRSWAGLVQLAWLWRSTVSQRDRKIPSLVGVNEMWYVPEKSLYFVLSLIDGAQNFRARLRNVKEGKGGAHRSFPCRARKCEKNFFL